MASALSAPKRSPHSVGGTTTTSCGVLTAVATVLTTACYSTRIATGRSIATGYLWRNRVRRRAFERLELLAGKLARAVLRGRDGGNVILLPGPGGSDVFRLPDACGAEGMCGVRMTVRRLRGAYIFRRRRMGYDSRHRGRSLGRARRSCVVAVYAPGFCLPLLGFA